MLFILKELLKCLLTFPKKYYSFQRLVQSSAASIEGCWFNTVVHFSKTCCTVSKKCVTLCTETLQKVMLRYYICLKRTPYYFKRVLNPSKKVLSESITAPIEAFFDKAVLFFLVFFFWCSVFPNAFAFLKARGQNLEKRDHVVELPPFRLSKPVFAASLPSHSKKLTWQCVKTLYPCSSHQNSW